MAALVIFAVGGLLGVALGFGIGYVVAAGRAARRLKKILREWEEADRIDLFEELIPTGTIGAHGNTPNPEPRPRGPFRHSR